MSTVDDRSDDECSATYSIKAVSEATGLTVETLRAWERRYRVIEPRRGAGGHRMYTSRDVSRLRRLRETTARGHPIGKIAHLSNDALAHLLADPSRQDTAAPSLIARILSAVESYRPTECDQAMAMAFALLPPFDVVRDVLTPVLHEVGDRWHRGEFSIAQERIASTCARRQLTALLHTFNSVAKGPSVVFATMSGERHEIGILMHAVLASSLRVRSYYLGPDLPPEEAGLCALKVKAAAVAVSVVMPDVESCLPKIEMLRQHLPDHVEIWIGGPAVRALDPAKCPAGSVRMAEPGDFEQRIALLTSAK